jgi:hypothetical protein
MDVDERENADPTSGPESEDGVPSIQVSHRFNAVGIA